MKNRKRMEKIISLEIFGKDENINQGFTYSFYITNKLFMPDG